MPMKDPGLWAVILGWLAEHQPVIYGVVLSMGTAALRVVYGGGKRRQALLEAIMCGAIALTLMSGMDWMGVPASASGFVGGMVGFLGVETVREYAQRFLGKKAGMVMEKGNDE